MRKKTVLVAGIICGGLLLLGLAMVGVKLASPRQSAVRANAACRALILKQCLDDYCREHKALPDSLRDAATISAAPEVLAEFEYVAGKSGLIAYWRKPFRAVKKGEPWGGLDEKADGDIPEARLVLVEGEAPKFMNESEFQSKYRAVIAAQPAR